MWFNNTSEVDDQDALVKWLAMYADSSANSSFGPNDASPDDRSEISQSGEECCVSKVLPRGEVGD